MRRPLKLNGPQLRRNCRNGGEVDEADGNVARGRPAGRVVKPPTNRASKDSLARRLA